MFQNNLPGTTGILNFCAEIFMFGTTGWIIVDTVAHRFVTCPVVDCL